MSLGGSENYTQLPLSCLSDVCAGSCPAHTQLTESLMPMCYNKYRDQANAAQAGGMGWTGPSS